MVRSNFGCVNPIKTIGGQMRDMSMTTDAEAIRFGVVDALLDVIGYKF